MVFIALKNSYLRTSLGVQWLKLHTPNVGSEGSIPGLGNKISHAAQCRQNKKPQQKLLIASIDPDFQKFQEIFQTSMRREMYKNGCWALFLFNMFSQLIRVFFIYLLFWAVLGLCRCAWAFSSCCKWGLLFLAVLGLLTAVASLILEHRLQAQELLQLWLAASRAQVSWLWCMGLVALRHVGSSWTRD